MRAVLILAAVGMMGWALPVGAQTVVSVGQPFTVQADHDGTGTEMYFALALSSPVVASSSVLANGVVTLPPIAIGTPGRYSVQVAAVINGGTEILSAPATVDVVPVQLGSCAYVSPAGIASTKAIGNDDVRGWNQLDTSDLTSVRTFYARMQQLRAWGLEAQVLAYDAATHRAYVYAPCVGQPQ